MSFSVLLGISGSIAAFKIPELVRLLTASGISVTPVVTNAAQQFVGVGALQALSAQKVYTDSDFFQDPSSPHISLAKSHSMMVVAPASANSIAKFAQGLCDNLCSALFLTFDGPKLIVPAMHHEMWLSSTTQENIKILKDRGVHVLSPV